MYFYTPSDVPYAGRRKVADFELSEKIFLQLDMLLAKKWNVWYDFLSWSLTKKNINICLSEYVSFP
jgi:hypothetical protein